MDQTRLSRHDRRPTRRGPVAQWPVANPLCSSLSAGCRRKMSSSRRMSGPYSMLADGRTPLRDSTTARPANLDNFGHYEGGKDCMGALERNVHTHTFLSEQNRATPSASFQENRTLRTDCGRAVAGALCAARTGRGWEMRWLQSGPWQRWLFAVFRPLALS